MKKYNFIMYLHQECHDEFGGSYYPLKLIPESQEIYNVAIRTSKIDEEELIDHIYQISINFSCLGFMFGKDMIKYYNDRSVGTIPIYSDSYGNYHKMDIDPKKVMYDYPNEEFTFSMELVNHFRVPERKFKQNRWYTVFKGTNDKFMCRNVLYKIGETYEEDDPSLCERGIHACMYPLDCFSYYMPSESKYFFCRGRLFDTLCDLESINSFLYSTKAVFSKLTLDSRMNIDDILGHCLNCVGSENIYGYDDYGALDNCDILKNEPIVICKTIDGNTPISFIDRNYTYINSTDHLEYVKGKSSVAVTNKPDSIVSAFGETSIAKASHDSSIASTFGLRSIAYCRGIDSVAVVSDGGSLATTNGKFSVAISSLAASKAETNGEFSVAVEKALGKSSTNADHSVSVSLGQGESETHGNDSVCVGLMHSKINVLGNKSVGIGYCNSYISVKAGNVGVAVIDLTEDAVNFLYNGISVMKGEIGSVLIWNFNDGNKIIESYSFIVDGKEVNEGVWYICTEEGQLIPWNDLGMMRNIHMTKKEK